MPQVDPADPSTLVELARQALQEDAAIDVQLCSSVFDKGCKIINSLAKVDSDTLTFLDCTAFGDDNVIMGTAVFKSVVREAKDLAKTNGKPLALCTGRALLDHFIPLCTTETLEYAVMGIVGTVPDDVRHPGEEEAMNKIDNAASNAGGKFSPGDIKKAKQVWVAMQIGQVVGVVGPGAANKGLDLLRLAHVGPVIDALEGLGDGPVLDKNSPRGTSDLSTENMIGSNVGQSGQWVDGLVTAAVRKAIRRGQGSVVAIRATADSFAWFDSLAEAFDPEIRVLELENFGGDSIDLIPAGVRFAIVTPTFSMASPKMVCLCRMVHVP